MQLVYVLLALIAVVLIGYFINTYIPMAGSIKAILNIVVVLATIVGVLQQVGLWGRVVRMWDDLTHRELHS